MKTINEQQATENPVLNKPVEPNTKFKNMIIEYVGINSETLLPNLHHGDEGKVTVQMIVDVFAKEFPEFLMVVAEENWIRGYHQALADVDYGQRAAAAEKEQTPDEEWVLGPMYRAYGEDFNPPKTTLENNE